MHKTLYSITVLLGLACASWAMPSDKCAQQTTTQKIVILASTDTPSTLIAAHVIEDIADSENNQNVVVNGVVRYIKILMRIMYPHYQSPLLQ
jgi:hypothetical protein